MNGRRGKALVAVVGLVVSARVPLARRAQRRPRRGSRTRSRTPSSGSVLLAVVVLFGVGYAFQAARWRRIADTPDVPAAVVLRDADRRPRLQQRAARAHRRVPARRLAEPGRADAPAGARSGASCSTASATSSRSRCFFAIGLQAVASAAWLVRLAVGALLAVIAIAVVLVLARLYSRRRGHQRDAERARAGRDRSSARRSRCSASRSAATAPRPGSG